MWAAWELGVQDVGAEETLPVTAGDQTMERTDYRYKDRKNVGELRSDFGAVK
jgi:hypothetical protein